MSLIFKPNAEGLSTDEAASRPEAPIPSRPRQDQQAKTDCPVANDGAQPSAAQQQEGMPPLTGMRILEIGHFVAAPFAGRVLADLGAEVIKIEPPGGGDPARRWGAMIGDRSVWWSVHARNKRSIAVDLKSPKRARDRAAAGPGR